MATFDGLTEYFDSDKLSDVTLVLSNENLKAHKLILAQGSSYFKAALKGRFQEATSKRLILREDNQEAVKGVISYLYGLWFDGAADYLPYDEIEDPHSIGTKDNPVSFCYYQIHLLVAADKYGVNALVESVAEEFLDNLEELWDKEEDEVVGGVIEEVYDTPGARELQDVVAQYVADNMNQIGHQARLQKLIRAVPDLAVDVVKVLAERNNTLEQLLDKSVRFQGA